MLGTVDLLDSESACGMPVSLQIANLDRELVARFGEGFAVQNVDLYSLEGDERHAALDVMVAGDPSPFVLVNGRVVCTGSVDVGAVLDALAASPEGAQ